ncbi:MAG TPA: response regulator transcription factor [Terriglobales bacterium]|nr:response regulator transcription factor [Terriglobales bacterium]
MKVLIADDDPVYCRMFSALLGREYELVFANDGGEAWDFLNENPLLRLAILDWQMPIFTGVELCKKIRSVPELENIYLLIATARNDLDDVVTGFNAGANDFVVKPFHAQELLARVRVGQRIVELQTALSGQVQELKTALAKVNQLQGLLPICSYCKRIRDDNDYWQQLETYFGEHSAAIFSHGICPDCYEKFMLPEIRELRSKQ